MFMPFDLFINCQPNFIAYDKDNFVDDEVLSDAAPVYNELYGPKSGQTM